MIAAEEETIFAVSSGAPPAAIAIIRISGRAASKALTGLAGRLPEPRRAGVASLRSADGALLDEALALWFPGPATATGEDLAELHVHGGRATVAAVMDALAAIAGCRLAAPGEFTRRAFANGRIDLAQAEGLADLLTAETEAERKRALGVARGGISRLVEEWRSRLLALGARVEASIEFGEEEEDVDLDPALCEDIRTLAGELAQTLAAPPAERLRDGFRIVVAGPPNAGKSTLVNALAGRPVAIAGPIAGTTRDLLEAPTLLAGQACLFVDSAGLRDSDDAVEQQGIALARSAIEQCDLMLWLGEPADRPFAERVITLRTKIDEAGGVDWDLQAYDLAISAITGEGMKELQRAIVEHVGAAAPGENAAVLNLRQRALTVRAHEELVSGAMAHDVVIVAHHLQRAMRAFDAVIGRTGVEEMLDALFGRFCIGK